MKFSKQFKGQLIPEWKEAFVDYWKLKNHLKRIQLVNNTNKHQISSVLELPFSISSLTKYSLFGNQQREHEPIHVHRKLVSSASEWDMYETQLLEQFADNDATKEFFTCLDHQLNKVNKFYRTKEKEFLERGVSLKKQMDILLELKSAFMEKKGSGRSFQNSKGDDSDSVSSTFSSEEDSVRSREQTDDLEKYEATFSASSTSDEDEKSTETKREGGCEGKNVRINIPLTTPSQTLSAISYLVGDMLNQSSRKCSTECGMIHVNKTRLHHAEKMIKRGFIELHKGLGYLNDYRNLNLLAFIQILKKFDKVTEKQILPTYLKVVESSYFNSSDKVVKFIEEVEELFVKNFAKDDHRKALKYLRPSPRKESHAIVFFIGIFWSNSGGCSSGNAAAESSS